MKNNRLAIITVFYNNYHVADDFFSSLEKQRNKNFKLFIADLSDEKKRQSIKTQLSHSVIYSRNLGYAHGVNLGIKKAIENGFVNFCIVNNDVYFKPDFVDSILNSLKKHPSSIIGGKIYYAPGFEYHKDRYQKRDLGKVIWYASGSFDWKNVFTPHRGVDEVDKGQYDQLEKAEFITGCLMIFDKKVIDRVGFWDESYFLYYEDADFCYRAIKKRVNLFYNPKIVLWHKNAQSTEGSGSKIHQIYQEKNRLKFGLKYAPLKTKIHLIINLLNKSFGS